MLGIDFIELLGYTATFFVAASFLFKSIVSLRTVNCIGAILFVIYGLVKQTYPVALLNIFLVARKSVSTVAIKTGETIER